MALGVAPLGIQLLVHPQGLVVVVQRLVDLPLILQHGAQVVEALGQFGVSLGVALQGVQLLAHP
jgi:hypothetical protein